jgi:hypothetical protein
MAYPYCSDQEPARIISNLWRQNSYRTYFAWPAARLASDSTPLITYRSHTYLVRENFRGAVGTANRSENFQRPVRQSSGSWRCSHHYTSLRTFLRLADTTNPSWKIWDYRSKMQFGTKQFGEQISGRSVERSIDKALRCNEIISVVIGGWPRTI